MTGLNRLDNALGDAVVIAKVDEKQTAVIAFAVNPAGDPDPFANIGHAELAAVVASKVVHLDQVSEGCKPAAMAAAWNLGRAGA